MPKRKTAASPLPPIEIAFPDLTAHASGNAGMSYAWTFESSRSGPHVLVQALTHGNEVCGAIVLDRFLREGLRPVRGTLSLVFANVAAYQRFDSKDPFASRCVDEDFNRLWTASVLDGERASAELTRARELRPLYDQVDYLLDLHSMSEPCPPLAMAGRQHKGVELAQAIGIPQHIVIDGGHASGRRLRDYAFFDDPDDVRNALLIECGQHWETASPHVATQATLRFLRHFGMIDAERLERELEPLPPAPQRLIEVTTTVTIATDAFRFTRPVRALQSIKRAGTVYAADGETEIRTPHDDCVLIMPTRRPRKGETAVRLGRYVA
ncbi:MAG TPA: succinylglutamate desuccinylase/aspartoacylase family protein [Casimicrobiaceae bacterium]|nr:succinylglutamate desuccinylase/aspartoacylase family protein [Casimicrobiaceae bacterium]